ncbi:hypothetical protein [Moorena producens]|uniref:hypothetical protein n=1 Tax=Moorena producens TaxID=1155739 RepID=UPI0011EA62CC|nr:hypothetical protein [Moorena producens]
MQRCQTQTLIGECDRKSVSAIALTAIRRGTGIMPVSFPGGRMPIPLIFIRRFSNAGFFPDSRFPIPYSLLPTPYSLLLKTHLPCP